MTPPDSRNNDLKALVKYARSRPNSFLLLSILFEIVYWPLLALTLLLLLFADLALLAFVLSPFFILSEGGFADSWVVLPLLACHGGSAWVGSRRHRIRVNAQTGLERENKE